MSAARRRLKPSPRAALQTLALLCICAGSGEAHGEPGGVSGVSGPNFTEGETRLEVRTAYFDGGALDDSWNHRALLSHGVTDWWRPALNFRASQPAGESAELTSIAFENVFDLTETREWPVHFGLLAEYKFGMHGVDDAIDIKLLGEAESGAFTGRFNLIATAQFNDGDAEWAPAYAARGVWRASREVSLGLEAYGEPDVDAHYFGPRATVRIGDATLALGYLAGVGDARANNQIRVGIEFTP
jgi:hypothetical protein